MTYTIAYDRVSSLLFACIPDGGDLEAALAEVEANGGLEINRATLCTEEGLTLTDEVEEGDDLRFTGGSSVGELTDEVGGRFNHAVMRS